jgi:hypothetical protein
MIGLCIAAAAAEIVVGDNLGGFRDRRGSKVGLCVCCCQHSIQRTRTRRYNVPFPRGTFASTASLPGYTGYLHGYLEGF